MPELPEVETIRRQLDTFLPGCIITHIDVRLPKQLSGDIERVKGAEIQRVKRYGKGLVIDLDNNYSLAIHVKMTGQLIYRESALRQAQGRFALGSGESKLGTSHYRTKLSPKVGQLPGKHTHVIFKLKSQNAKGKSTIKKSKGESKSDAYLYFNDIRQFGWIKILKTEDVDKLAFFKSLGPEFLKDLTLEKFSKILQSNKSPVKLLIMDQSKMAGVGNIYANDALYRARIHPKQPANSLNKEEVKRLFDSIEEVLKLGLKAGGSSEWSYVDALGQEGSYQKIFLVYGQQGKKCKRCGEIIQKITLGGRGTFFCPACQQLTI